MATEMKQSHEVGKLYGNFKMALWFSIGPGEFPPFQGGFYSYD